MQNTTWVLQNINNIGSSEKTKSSAGENNSFILPVLKEKERMITRSISKQ